MSKSGRTRPSYPRDRAGRFAKTRGARPATFDASGRPHMPLRPGRVIARPPA
jgi:hypothetical protein